MWVLVVCCSVGFVALFRACRLVVSCLCVRVLLSGLPSPPRVEGHPGVGLDAEIHRGVFLPWALGRMGNTPGGGLCPIWFKELQRVRAGTGNAVRPSNVPVASPSPLDLACLRAAGEALLFRHLV